MDRRRPAGAKRRRHPGSIGRLATVQLGLLRHSGGKLDVDPPADEVDEPDQVLHPPEAAGAVADEAHGRVERLDAALVMRWRIVLRICSR